MPVILILFLIFLLIYNSKLKKAGNEKNLKDYISQEKDALFVRKKSLADLEYIKPDLNHLPTLMLSDQLSSEEKKAYEKQVLFFETANLPMIHLAGKNNTELKLAYGPANLEVLTEYEENYILFLQRLLDWGKQLIKADRKSDGIKVLETGIILGTDLSQNFLILADLYFEYDQVDKMDYLLQKAQTHDSPMMKKVIQHINNLLDNKNEEEHI